MASLYGIDTERRFECLITFAVNNKVKTMDFKFVWPLCPFLFFHSLPVTYHFSYSIYTYRTLESLKVHGVKFSWSTPNIQCTNLIYLCISNYTGLARIVVTMGATIIEVVIEGQENVNDISISPSQ